MTSTIWPKWKLLFRSGSSTVRGGPMANWFPLKPLSLRVHLTVFLHNAAYPLTLRFTRAVPIIDQIVSEFEAKCHFPSFATSTRFTYLSLFVLSLSYSACPYCTSLRFLIFFSLGVTTIYRFRHTWTQNKMFHLNCAAQPLWRHATSKWRPSGEFRTAKNK